MFHWILLLSALAFAAASLHSLPESDSDLKALRAQLPRSLETTSKAYHAQKAEEGAEPHADLLPELMRSLSSARYRAYARINNRLVQHKEVTTSDIESWLSARDGLGDDLAKLSETAWSWHMSENKAWSSAADTFAEKIRTLFPSYTFEYGAALTHIERARDYDREIARLSGNRDFVELEAIPSLDSWGYIDQLTDVTGCDDIDKVSAKRILQADAGARKIKTPFLKKRATEKLQQLLSFAGTGGCICQTFAEANEGRRRINRALAPAGLKLKAPFTQKSHTYGRDNCQG